MKLELAAIKAMDTALAEVFGRYSARWSPTDPLEKLIQRILGQRTTHTHVDRAMANLRTHCADWSAVARLDPDVLVDLVRPAGLARQKAGRIQSILSQIQSDTDAYTLDFIHSMSNQEATRYLRTLPGVGEHTAALVLMFALGRPGIMPVETHVHRVGRRLGWVDHEATMHSLQQTLESAAPAENLMDLHVNLFDLGQRHCGTGAPDCLNCPVSHLCRTALLQPEW